jgi:glutamine cyclotransferase
MKTLVFASLTLLMLAACDNPDQQSTDSPATEAPGNAPSAMAYTLLKDYPHDTGAFTQGLVWYNNQLLEGTGQYGESDVRRVDLATGKVLQQTANDSAIFGEGIAVLNGKLYQITWQNKIGYVYDAATLKKEKAFTLQTEGWGLTTDGKELILSDGSSNLYFLDPKTLTETHRIGVYDHLGPRSNINELEYIKGYVYANVWQTDNIIKIDPASGRIVAVADLSDLKNKGGIQFTYDGTGPDVLNGIAWDSANNRIFVTGKYWPKLFEIKLDQ